jgi:hypothetical protein
MLETRRQLLFGVVSTVGVFASASSFASGRTQYPPLRPTPPTASNPGSLAGVPKPVNSHVLTQKNQELLKADLDQLYQLASELRKEYQAANPNAVLSVTFIKMAEQAEKIAKQVKNLARG